MQCNGGKLNDIDGFSNIYSVYCVLENRNRSAQVRELLSNNSVSCKKINHSRYALVI